MAVRHHDHINLIKAFCSAYISVYARSAAIVLRPITIIACMLLAIILTFFIDLNPDINNIPNPITKLVLLSVAIPAFAISSVALFIMLTAMRRNLRRYAGGAKSPKVYGLKLDHLALLVMTIEQADERLGDLDERRQIVQSRHGVGYARFWYWWTGIRIIAAAARQTLPGWRLLEALISRISAKS